MVLSTAVQSKWGSDFFKADEPTNHCGKNILDMEIMYPIRKKKNI